MRFDLVDLKLFSNVVEARSLTRGAEHSHISLAAASARIRNLEDYIGVTLLSRSNQGVTMTSAGETLVAYARRVIRELEQLSGELQEFSSGLRGHIRLFANTTAMSEYLPAVLRSYLVSHPEITIDMQERLSGDIVRSVKEGVADIGIVAGDVHAADIEVIPYRRDRLVLVVALSHPLAARDGVMFADTLGFDHVGLSEAAAIHGFLKRAATDMHHDLRWRVQVSNFEAACRMIEANVGVGILPKSTAMRHEKAMGIRIVPLHDAWAERRLQICVANRVALPVFARRLVDVLSADGEGRQD
ncbi:LysR substrate-binding domain-containing protein [Cupriavidus sp. 2SB]|uniref:LysR family transcriptional regulator n=1 Tax=Cupriavidus sp. 2SB TaxID=2502199 RepID=UPI0010FA18C9|nr:LysR substrate-binding domain-containing protein [Cupriavidus sp. 2SB]